jgi:signal transduction histidine kinase/ActR/RegA family two-component response regulator
MSVESVLARIADNPRLPTPPALTLRVLERANQPTCSIAELGKLISVDPALCGRMLRLVNSSLYGLQNPVTSIERSLNLLGLNHVRSLVLSLSLPSLNFQRSSSEQVKACWKNSVTMAIVCRELATRMGWPDPDSEMVAGLLCDFGVLVLQEAFPEHATYFASIPPEAWLERQCQFEAERIGVDHADAGAFFLKRWRLGDDLTEAIRFHHRPAEAPPAYAARATCLYFASLIAQLHQTRASTSSEIVRLAHERYRMDQKQLLAFLDSLRAKIDELASLMDVQMGPRESFAELFARSTENLTRLAVEASLNNVRINEEKTQVERHLQEATQALRQSEEQLLHAQKMEAIGRLAGGVAHDFNNLLTVINGNCEMLLELHQLDSEARELIEMILRNGERAANLTKQLVAFSRKQRMVSEVVNLNTVIADMVNLLRRLLGNDVQLATNLADNLVRVRVDPGQMEQVITNLAINARDAMPNGGSLTIETFNLQLDAKVAAQHAEAVPGPYAVIAVRDTGTGMEDGTLKKIFEPFFTTKPQGKGTGLGLAIVHGIVRQSRGHITVSSTVGAGTVFHIYLPATSKTPETNSIEFDMVGDSKTILLVDDEESVREFTRRALANSGFTVLAAKGGAEALNISDHFPDPIDLLITDNQMPNMTGMQLTEQMVKRRPDIQTIVVSGYSEELPGSPTPDAKIAFLQKPFTTEQLTSLIRRVLSKPATKKTPAAATR